MSDTCIFSIFHSFGSFGEIYFLFLNKENLFHGSSTFQQISNIRVEGELINSFIFNIYVSVEEEINKHLFAMTKGVPRNSLLLFCLLTVLLPSTKSNGCTDTQCTECSPPETCTACNPGYFIEGTSCTQCPPNCATCTSSTACTGCKHNLQGDTC